jgi:hypothetical protein
MYRHLLGFLNVRDFLKAGRHKQHTLGLKKMKKDGFSTPAFKKPHSFRNPGAAFRARFLSEFFFRGDCWITWKSMGVIAILVLSIGTPVKAQDANQVILGILPSMPVGGGYSVDSSATRHLAEATSASHGVLEINPALAYPTYCSGATYLVFLRALQAFSVRGSIPDPLANLFSIHGQRDGTGVWGRWNANGPGTACLFRELHLGRNFTSFDLARPGDFMKIFWSDEVGNREHGHSVIYLGQNLVDGIPSVTFWSSNLHVGYSEKTVPRSKIVHAIFSRLEYPQNIRNAVSLPARNRYLSNLVNHGSTFEEALRESGQ